MHIQLRMRWLGCVGSASLVKLRHSAFISTSPPLMEYNNTLTFTVAKMNKLRPLNIDLPIEERVEEYFARLRSSTLPVPTPLTSPLITDGSR